MFSGRRTGMRALVWRLYIPLGPLATASLVPPSMDSLYLDRRLLEMDIRQARSARPVVDDCNV